LLEEVGTIKSPWARKKVKSLEKDKQGKRDGETSFWGGQGKRNVGGRRRRKELT